MKEQTPVFIALDIEDVQHGKRGAKMLNLMLSSKGKLYRTARGRLAMQLRPDVYEKIKGQLKVTFSEGLDGCTHLAPSADSNSTTNDNDTNVNSGK